MKFALVFLLLCGCGSGGDAPVPPSEPGTFVSLRHGFAGRTVTEAVLSGPLPGLSFRTVEPSPFLAADVTYPWAEFESGEYSVSVRLDDGSVVGPVTVFVAGDEYVVEVDP